MADKKPFLLRVDRSLLDAYQRWAADDLRSVNGQIEFVLREALKRAGRTDGGRSDGGRMTDDGRTEERGDDAQDR